MITFPVDCVTPAQKTEYAYRCQELLRELHNVMGTWYREGISRQLWDRLPTRIQVRYPYQRRLSQDQWKDFLATVFEPVSNKIADVICAQRGLLKASTTWVTAIEDLI